MKIDPAIQPADLKGVIDRLFALSAEKIASLEKSWSPESGAPVFTAAGRYTSRGWTEWTQGFQFGAPILQFDATGHESFLAIGRAHTVDHMAGHVTHTGVHDHGFNNVSTYGNLWRLMNEGRIEENAWERRFYEMALKCSGAVQAARWTNTREGGYIYSFNGPHSLFVDTIRTLRALAVAHQLGHALYGENDCKISLLDRLVQHAQSTARYSVFYGEGRDIYDIRGRTVHECVFNINDGNFRAPATQQGYSPFSTWTRGLAWAMCGFAEELEYLEQPPDWMLKAAEATCDFYMDHATASDGIPYWDTGAPELYQLGDWQSRPAEPFNDYEPVDSSAASVAAQGLLRLGHYLNNDRYWKAGLTVARSLFAEPYLSTDSGHQGLILHSVYHRPNGWDAAPAGVRVPAGESSMWGDYHARELALYLKRVIEGGRYFTFFSSGPRGRIG